MIEYKKIVKSRDLRFKILNLFKWVPDRIMIKIQYQIKTGRKLNLDKPERFTEKLQWYKLYYRNPIMHKCADKYEVRKYVKAKGLKGILNELYGIYDSPDEIDFEKLPSKFVIKTTAGTGGQNVLLCKDRNELDIDETKKTLRKWLKLNPKKSFGREWAYEGIKNRIIIEKYIESGKECLDDYKFFCFDGKVEYMYIITERDLGRSAKLGIYDANCNKIEAYRCDEQRQSDKAKKPKNFDKMKDYASILSKDFPHARVDFYCVDGRIIIGEITFYDGSGYMKYNPDAFDFELGKCFKIKGVE